VSRSPRADRRFALGIGVVLGLGLVLRALYVLAQPGTDPWFAVPQLDGATYLGWAQALAAGAPGPTGAYYLAPLYPWLLALLVRVGAGGPFALYALQQALSLATAALLALGIRSRVGSAGAIGAAALFLGYAPIEFFASRPLGETLAIALLVAALALGLTAKQPAALGAVGLLVGCSALARPNLLLVAFSWIAVEAVRRRPRRVLALAAGVALALLPVTARNVRASGHLVPISSNGGLTLYHGNGPGARGIYQPPDGFPRGLTTIDEQRDAAVRIARARTGRALDAVEADAYWGRAALEARIARPRESLGLLVRRVVLLLGNHEFGLDYPPLLDSNPWRSTLRLGTAEIALVPWAALVGLAASALVRYGIRGTGGGWTWAALLACAATPVLFYVSSRYRLPAAGLLAIPAGRGLAGLVQPGSRRGLGLALGLLAFALSVAAFDGALAREDAAGGRANRSVAWRHAGRMDAAEADARAAVETVPTSAWLRYNLGVVLMQAQRAQEAEAAYRESLRLEPDLADASANLGAMLFAQGRLAEATTVLRAAVVFPTAGLTCWTNLVSVLVANGDTQGARATIAAASAKGFSLPPDLVRIVEEQGK
jgi:tetratricopeptide (TPR) repeat protein